MFSITSIFFFFFLKDPLSKSRLDYKLKVTFHLKMVKVLGLRLGLRLGLT